MLTGKKKSDCIDWKSDRFNQKGTNLRGTRYEIKVQIQDTYVYS